MHSMEDGGTEHHGINEDSLRRLVGRFYAKVRLDPDLGPVFNGAVHDWPEHLERLQAFWSSVMLTTGRYKGQPMAAHMKHEPKMKPELFQRWLDLWRETAAEVLTPEATEAVVEKAERIAESLQLGLSFARGEHPMTLRRAQDVRGGPNG